ncbi:Adaptive-response sensory-kinase SasA [anaerobic digester metagenome]
MKIKFRFLSFFAIGLLGFMFYIGAVMTIIFDILLPMIGILHAENNLIIFILILLLSIVSGGALFSFYFIKPLLTMLHMIAQLSKGIYEISALKDKLYTKHGKLKVQYFLYSELVSDISNLSALLEKARNDQAYIEQAKQEWIRGISHDLKTPLSYILGYSTLLAKEDYNWEEDEKKKFLDEIYTKGKYMEQLISDLKLSIDSEHSNIPIMPISPETFSLVPFLQKIIIDMANQLNAKNYNFDFEFEDDKIEIFADKQLLYRAFQNLLTNAVNHNPPSSAIRISLHSDDEFILITFSDNGQGLDERNIDTLTKTEMAINSGRGLAVVRNIVLSHKGIITVDTTKDCGTKINISLPK